MSAAAIEPVLAVDIGGTSLRLGTINLDGQLIGDIKRYDVPFAADGKADLNGILAIMAEHVDKARQLIQGELKLGISLCGNVDLESGDAILVPNLHWRELPFGKLVSQRFQLPVCVATDVRQAALAEAVWGWGKGERNFAWATVGTGYGGYLFLHGRLYGGAHGFAGNFGHTTWDEINGHACGCGRRGCFETFVAGPAIARAGQAAMEAGESPVLAELEGGDELSARHVFRAIELGDPAAAKIVDDAIRLICINLGGVVNLLDIKLIVMGGGVAKAASWLIPRINREIRAHLMTREAQRDLRVLPESTANAALWGAAAHVYAVDGALPGALLEEGLRHRAIGAF